MTTVDGETDPAGGQQESADSESPLYRFGSPEERSRAVVHSLGLVAFAFLVGLVLVSLGQGLLDSIGLTTETAPIAAEIVPTGLYFSGLFAACVFYIQTTDGQSLLHLTRPTLRDAGWVVVGFVALVGTLVGLDFLLSALGFEPATNEAVEVGRDHPRLFLFYIPLVVLLNAPAEELLFRGLVQGLFRQAYGIIPAILAASVVFGAVHYVALVGSGSKVAYVSIALASGLVLGTAYELSDTLVVPVVVHTCWNVLVYLNEYAQAI